MNRTQFKIRCYNLRAMFNLQFYFDICGSLDFLKRESRSLVIFANYDLIQLANYKKSWSAYLKLGDPLPLILMNVSNFSLKHVNKYWSMVSKQSHLTITSWEEFYFWHILFFFSFFIWYILQNLELVLILITSHNWRGYLYNKNIRVLKKKVLKQVKQIFNNLCNFTIQRIIF